MSKGQSPKPRLEPAPGSTPSSRHASAIGSYAPGAGRDLELGPKDAQLEDVHPVADGERERPESLGTVGVEDERVAPGLDTRQAPPQQVDAAHRAGADPLPGDLGLLLGRRSTMGGDMAAGVPCRRHPLWYAPW